MRFYYPNFTNDMWRIFGLCFFNDKLRFVDATAKSFRLEPIKAFLTTCGIGLYDTATAVRRLKNTASDKDLEVVQPTDLQAMVRKLPQLTDIVTTGQKATDTLCQLFSTTAPSIGSGCPVCLNGRNLTFFRMPSSSRAYPLSLERKAAFYKGMLETVGILNGQ